MDEKKPNKKKEEEKMIRSAQMWISWSSSINVE